MYLPNFRASPPFVWYEIIPLVTRACVNDLPRQCTWKSNSWESNLQASWSQIPCLGKCCAAMLQKIKVKGKLKLRILQREIDGWIWRLSQHWNCTSGHFVKSVPFFFILFVIRYQVLSSSSKQNIMSSVIHAALLIFSPVHSVMSSFHLFCLLTDLSSWSSSIWYILV